MNMGRPNTDSFTLTGMTFRGQRWLTMDSVLAYLYAFAEAHDKCGQPDDARVIRNVAEQLRNAERT
jgi:hypothetical protein